MKDHLHLITSSLVGFALVTFTAVSAFSSGIAAEATVVGFALLAVYGLVEMALSDYLPWSASPRMKLPRPVAEPFVEPVTVAAPRQARQVARRHWHFRVPHLSHHHHRWWMHRTKVHFPKAAA